MSRNQEYEKMYIAFIVFAVLILGMNIYYFAHPLLYSVGMTHEVADYLILPLRRAGYLSTPYKTKIAAMLILMLCCIVRSGKGKKVEPAILVTMGLLSMLAYLFPFENPLLYLISTISGSTGLTWTFTTIGRLFARFNEHGNDLRESFEQESEPVKGEYSIILPTKYFFNKKYHNGFISVVNPFRGTLVVGSAGSGKSFSVFNPFIEQMIEHGYTMMLYDFKMPDLSKVVYNAYMRNRGRFAKPPAFYCINFKDPVKSNRCNPIAAEYFTDIIDASETARVVMEALNKGNEKKDFFFMSAQQYIGICLWYLRIYTPEGGRKGDWCDFPHLIELINQDYNKVLSMVKRHRALDGKARVFIDALEANAQDQLQGQIASARIPLNDIASPTLYWVLSGNDFNLDINDPDDPKILCIGNDPDRQQVYGAALSLFTFRVIKRVNKPGKLPCGVIMDELPTISVQGLDGLMATARSNKVAVVLGVQDISQIVADYGEKVAEKIIALPANVFVGSSSVKTAEKYSKEFGKEFRRQESQTRSIDSESLNISFHEEEIMPIRKITSLPQGTFIGKVAVDNKTPIGQPFFCGSIQIDMEEYARKSTIAKDIPDILPFDFSNLHKDLGLPTIAELYITDHFVEVVTKEWSRRPRKEYKESDIRDEAARRTRCLTDRQRKRLIEQLMPKLEQDEIAHVIEENFYAIKNDIEELVAAECPTQEEGEIHKELSPMEELAHETQEDNDESAVSKAEMSVDTLDIDKSFIEALHQAEIFTVDQFKTMTREQIRAINGIGAVGLKVIEDDIYSRGIRFSDDMIKKTTTMK